MGQIYQLAKCFILPGNFLSVSRVICYNMEKGGRRICEGVYIPGSW
jgi:hypothetical protein